MKFNHHYAIKPLSANKMFYRNKNKTAEYRKYQLQMADHIGEDRTWPFEGPVQFTISCGLSSKVADLDNVLKPLFDTYQTIYEEFNDREVYRITATKEIVGRGDEYLSVQVEQLESGQAEDKQATEEAEEPSAS